MASHRLDIVLSSNIPPTEREITSVRDLLRCEEATVIRLGEEIQNLQSHLEELNRRYSTSQGEVLRYKAVLSPARLLPPELVRKIFLECIAELPDDVVLSPLHTPLSLSQICSGWRGVALATPELWTNFAFEALNSTQMQLFQGMAEHWFNRCSTRFMSFKFSSKQYSEALSTSLFKVLYENSRNIRYLDVDFDSTFYSEFSRFAEESFPHLELIRFRGATPRGRDDYQGRSDAAAFSHAPKLTDVAISLSYTRFDLEDANLPWSQLSNLDLGETFIPLHSLLRVLPSCVNLTSCSVLFAAHHDLLIAQTFTLPLLANLSIYTRSEAASMFLPHLTLPSLANLSVKLIPHRIWHPDVLSDLILRSNCKLQTLHITCRSMDFDSFIDLIHVLPALESLSMEFEGLFMSDEVLSTMIPAVYEDPPLPLLRHLKWKDPFPSVKCTPQCIRRFIVSRGWDIDIHDFRNEDTQPVHHRTVRLESLVIDSGRRDLFDSVWEQDLNVFKDRGFKLSYGRVISNE